MRKLERARILVVDDERYNAEALAAYLRTSGACVVTALSVREAWGVLETTSLDVIVSDIAMPEGDGLDLIRDVRRDARYRSLACIAVSGLVDGGAEALAAGFDAYYAKPYAPSDLVREIASRLDRTFWN